MDRIDKAIEFFKYLAAGAPLSNVTLGKPVNKIRDFYALAATALEKMKNEQSEPEPRVLTLEELRKMDGQPVWIAMIEDGKECWACWKLLFDQTNLTQGFHGMCSMWLENYGKTWLVYDRPPKVQSGPSEAGEDENG